jgi:sugar phosphate permease
VSFARARIFGVTWLAYASFYLCRKNFSVLMPYLQNEAGIAKLRLADILFAYSLAYSLGQFLMGALADRFSPRVVVSCGLAIAAAANVAMYANPAYAWLLVLGMLNGFAQSSGWPGLLKIMAAWFRSSERGVIMGWWTTNYVFGGFLATLFAAWAVASGHWTNGFLWPALLLLAVAAVFSLLCSDQPAAVPGDATATPHAQGLIAGFRILLARPALWATAVAALLVKITRYAFLFWLPLYLSEQLCYKPDQAGYLSSVFELAGIPGALLAGYASDKLMRARRYPVVCMMLAGLAVACLIQPRLASTGWLGALAGIAIIGIMTFGPDTLLQGAASQDAGGAASAGSAAGVVNGIASVGQLISPYLVARVASRWGWDALFSVFVVIALIGAGIAGAFWRYQVPRPQPHSDRRNL